MAKWIENITECIIDKKILLKTSFHAFMNFSFIGHLSQEKLSRGDTFVFDGKYQTRFEFDIDEVLIDNCIDINRIVLNEDPNGGGIFLVEVHHTYRIPENFEIKAGYRGNASISHVADMVFERFKLLSTLYSTLTVLVPATLNLHIWGKTGWERVAQVGGGAPLIHPCNPDKFKIAIKDIASISNKAEKATANNKHKKVIDLYYSGLRFQSNRFYADAFLNFYKIIEMIFKSSEFSKKYSETLKKPSSYAGTLRHSSQKVQMLFIWEYLKEMDDNIDEKILASLLEMSDLRNNLAHGSTVDISLDKTYLAQMTARTMIDVFILC